MAITVVNTLDHWFAQLLSDIHCSREANAYITRVLSRMSNMQDMSRESIVLAYINASEKCDFVTYQRIGDWVLWKCSVIGDSDEVYETFGRISYSTCHNILKKKFLVYEELADELPRLTNEIHATITRVTAHVHRVTI